VELSAFNQALLIAGLEAGKEEANIYSQSCTDLDQLNQLDQKLQRKALDIGVFIFE
jgi:hypothetical protein